MLSPSSLKLRLEHRTFVLGLFVPIIIWAMAFAIYVSSSLYSLVYFRWVTYAVFSLFLPGYVLTDVLSVYKRNINFIEKIMLGSAMSVFIIGFLGYLLDSLSLVMSGSSIFFSLSFVILACVLIKEGVLIKAARTPKISVDQRNASTNRVLGINYYTILTIIIVLGIIVRLIPYMTTNALLDLDPYNYLMKIEAILSNGRIPSFDTLSLAPQGTSSTYTVDSLGFEILVVSLELMTQAPLVKLMGLLPVLYGALTILAISFLCREATQSGNIGLFAAFLAAFPFSWLMIYSVTMNPLAENIGLYLFVLALLFLVKYIKTTQKFYIIVSGILFGAMFYVHLFTVFYFVLVLLAYTLGFFLISRKRPVLQTTIWILFIGVLLSFPLLYQIVPTAVMKGNNFSNTATILAFSSGSYLVVLPQDLPALLTVQDGDTAALFMAMAVVAVGISWHSLRKSPQKYESYLLPICWCLVLLLASSLYLIVPLRSILAVTPFSGPIIYAHRIVPYLTLSFFLPVSIAVNDFIFPSSKILLDYGRKIGPNIRRILLICVLLIIPATSVTYTINLAYSPNSQDYSSFFAWVNNNSKPSDVFMVNNWDVSMWLRSVGKRPTVFSHVYQDLVSPDAETRMQLHTLVYSDNDSMQYFYEAVKLLKLYNVTYVVVDSRFVYVDTIDGKWVWGVQNLDDYIENMDSRGYLRRIYSDEDGIYVYRVCNVTGYSYRLNATNEKGFVGNGWTAPYYLMGLPARNASRGIVSGEWRFSDFYIPLDPKHDVYFLEIRYYDMESANPVDIFTYTSNGPVKIGSIILNGTLSLKTARFSFSNLVFYDYYNEKDGFQQYFALSGTSNFPIFDVMLQGS
jgi:hypothetical protein